MNTAWRHVRDHWKTYRRYHYPRDARLIVSGLRQRRNLRCPEEVWRIVDSVDGFLKPTEAGLMYWAATHWPLAGPAIELGSYCGRSTMVFALAGREVHAIDAWSDVTQDGVTHSAAHGSMSIILDRLQANIRRAGVEALITIHRGLTQEIGQHWKTKAPILFIDASHRYQDVKDDLALWTKFLSGGGMLLIKDIFGHYFPGVTAAAVELLQNNWRVIGTAASLADFVRG
jgi:predicted O-methyltransferase YrrM